MSPEAQRIAIAEACGWHQVIGDEWKYGMYGWNNPEGFNVPDSYLPDYLNDLNAMHDVTRNLYGDQQKQFRRALIDICQTPEDAIDATAIQRAEAFLRTLSLWEQ